MSVQVHELDIKTTAAKVRISSPALVNALIQDREKAMGLLKGIDPKLAVSKISVDEYGRIIVSDKEFAKKLSDRLKSAASINGICGLGC